MLKSKSRVQRSFCNAATFTRLSNIGINEFNQSVYLMHNCDFSNLADDDMD